MYLVDRGRTRFYGDSMPQEQDLSIVAVKPCFRVVIVVD